MSLTSGDIQVIKDVMQGLLKEQSLETDQKISNAITNLEQKLSKHMQLIVGNVEIKLRNEIKSSENNLQSLINENITIIREEMNQKFEQVDKRFEQVDKRFEQVDKQFVQVNDRFNRVDKRFDQMDSRFLQMDSRFDRIDQTLLTIAEEVALHIIPLIPSKDDVEDLKKRVSILENHNHS